MNPEDNPPVPEGVDYSFGIPVKTAPPVEVTGFVSVPPEVPRPLKPSPPPPLEVPPVKPSPAPSLEVSSANGDDETDYFMLAEPISVDGRSIDRLRINPKGVLKGKQFFSLVQRYQRKFPDEARSNFNKFTSENYLSLVLAEINKIAPEDLYKLPYED
jgi:hypothetical protein